MSLVEIFGRSLVWLVALVMIGAYPFTELARAMASNPEAFARSKGGCAISLAGIALLVMLIWF